MSVLEMVGIAAAAVAGGTLLVVEHRQTNTAGPALGEFSRSSRYSSSRQDLRRNGNVPNAEDDE